MEQALAFERELKDLTSRMAKAEEQHKTLFSRLDKQEKLLDTVHSLALSVNEIANKQENIQDKLNNLCDDVEVIKEKPAKRWEGLVEKVLYTVAGAMIAYMLGKMGIV